MPSVLTAQARRKLGLCLALVGASLAIQSALSAHWARALGIGQDRALLGIVLLHAVVAAAGLWRVRR